jgi:hypothetical protein
MINVDLEANEVGGQCGQPMILAIRPAGFDHHALTIDVAGFSQSLIESGEKRRSGCRAAEVADHRHRLLLRAQGAGRGCGGCERRNEVPTVHSFFMHSQPREN